MRHIAVVFALLMCAAASATTLDFETGLTDSAGTVWEVDSGIMISSSTAHSGTYSAYFSGANKCPMWTTDSRYMGVGSGDFEMSFWIYPTGGALNCIVGGGSTYRWVLYFTYGTNKLRFYDATPDIALEEVGASIVPNEWQKITFKRVSSAFSVYHNSTEIMSAVVPGDMLGGPLRLVLGGEYQQYFQPYVGFIDDVYFSWFGEATPTPAIHSPIGVDFAGTGKISFRGPTTRLGVDDYYTKALLHYDGDTVDQSGRYWVDYGAFSATDSAKFGVGCAYGSITSTDFSRSGDSEDWYFPGDFTIDCWFMPLYPAGAIENRKFLFYELSGAAIGFGFYIHDVFGTRSLVITTDNITKHEHSATISNSAWSHLAVSVSSNQYFMFVNGAVIGSGTIEQREHFRDGVGTGLLLSSTPGSGWPCLIDELRISKGIARWTSTFTPPASAYVAGRQGLVSIR